MSKFFDDAMLGLLEAAAIEYKKEPVKKGSKIKRVYEDDDWVIDLIDGEVRVSYFEDCHYVDEIVLSKEYFEKAGD